jgi:hypothetical protein
MNASTYKNERPDAGTSSQSENLFKAQNEITKNVHFVNHVIEHPSEFLEIHIDDHCLVFTPAEYKRFLRRGDSVLRNRDRRKAI